MNKLERQGIARLIDTFGATVLINMPEHEPLPLHVRAHSRYNAATLIERCTLCPLHATCRQPVAPQWPGDALTARAQALIVVEAPTEDDDKRGQPLSGRVGKIIRNALVTAGMEPDDQAYTYAVSCQPHDEGIWRAPSVYEQHQCHDNLLRTVNASDAQYVLLFGAVATRAWREDVRLTDVAGQLFIWQNRFVYPMFSVQAVLRQTFNANTWREQLGRFAQIVVEDQGTAALSKRCAECYDTVHAYDADGIPWCREHFAEHVGKREAQETRQGKRQVHQQTLLGE